MTAVVIGRDAEYHGIDVLAALVAAGGLMGRAEIGDTLAVSTFAAS